MRLGSFAAGMLAIALPVAAHAQDKGVDAGAMVDAIAECRKIADPQKRLACYDDATATLVDARDQRDILVLDREDVKKTKQALFGFSTPALPAFEAPKAPPVPASPPEPGSPAAAPRPERVAKAEKPRPRAERDDEEVNEIRTTIVSARTAGYNRWSMTLADGSEWVMIESRADLDPRKGDAIRIVRAALGSFRASIRGGTLIRVKRIG